MTENSYEQIDDLFAQIRLRLLKVRENDPTIAEELKNLLTQLEDCVESQVIEYLKLGAKKSRQRRQSR